ncbi:MAG: hypothetical protein HNEKOMLI_00670 [Sodalis sp. Psp]|nr:hypothetical protein [Sodalis sp. Psp]MCR3757136.1 hypothetical protein [Sodalis sp. Ppy]
MSVNGAYVLKGQLDFQLYIIVDINFIDRRADILQAIIADSELTMFTTLYGKRIIDRSTLSAVCCLLASIEDASHRIYRPKVPDENMEQHFGQNPHIHLSATHPNIAFSTDISNGVFNAGTVVFWAFQILLFFWFQVAVYRWARHDQFSSATLL